ncbi:MAG: hypothetical protein JEY79_10925 [Pseudodesulfovibrio sp.]|nr:hypothetical protein [Pseudodesulfovibrio sp.]
MRKIIMVAVVLALLVGCASKAERYILSLNTDAEKVHACVVLADGYTTPNTILRVTDKDRNDCLDFCRAVALQVPKDFHSPYWVGQLLLYRGDKTEACEAFKEATERGHPAAFGAYCNQDGSPK